MQKPYPSVQVFQSPFLEKFTHVHPLTPLILWLPVSMWLIWHSLSVQELSVIQFVPMAVIGFVSWTLAEYLLHRFLFHFERDTPMGHRFHFLVHGMHHVDPMDPTRLVMPPLLSLILAVFLFPSFQWVFGTARAEPFIAFFVMGYLCYDYIHFSVHHFTPRTRLGKYLKQSHMVHHFVSPNARWGVSSPFWDLVFGTMEDVKSKERAV